jgi:hypothetical protein
MHPHKASGVMPNAKRHYVGSTRGPMGGDFLDAVLILVMDVI